MPRCCGKLVEHVQACDCGSIEWLEREQLHLAGGEDL